MFLFMFVISIFAGALSTMNVWAADCSDIYFHLNDVYMVMLMTGWMLLFSLILDYKQPYLYFKLSFSIFLIFLTLYLIRTQTFISDKQFLRGMIPHHSMAITMSKNIQKKTKDPRIKKLANDIIKSQNNEIEIMKSIL